MATTKVQVHRQYYGPVPKDNEGNPFPRDQWPRRRTLSWLVRWCGTDGKRFSKSFSTQKEAILFAEEKQAEVRQGRGDPLTRIALRAFHDEHRTLMGGNIGRRTMELHLATLKLLASFVGWNRPLDAITVRDIERFRAQRMQQGGITSASANKELKTLRRIFNLAITRRYLRPGNNPCEGIPMIRVAPKRPRYVSADAFEGIYRRVKDPMWAAILVVIYTTGIRLREATNLRWQDVDFETGELHVTRKTAADYVQEWTPKDHEMRSIPLPRQAIALLTAWQTVAPEGCPYIFMEQDRWNYYREKVDQGTWKEARDLVNNVLRRFQTLCRKAGVEEFTLHDLRRSCITNWAKKLQIHVVQQLAGHSDIKTTQQYYLSVQPEDIKKAQAIQGAMVEKLPREKLSAKLLPNNGKKRAFPGKQGCQPKI